MEYSVLNTFTFYQFATYVAMWPRFARLEYDPKAAIRSISQVSYRPIGCDSYYIYTINTADKFRNLSVTLPSAGMHNYAMSHLSAVNLANGNAVFCRYLNIYSSLRLMWHIDGKLLTSATYRCSSLRDRDLYFREINTLNNWSRAGLTVDSSSITRVLDIDLALDLGLGHAAYRRASVIDLYLRKQTSLKSEKLFSGRSNRRDPSKFKVTWHKK